VTRGAVSAAGCHGLAQIVTLIHIVVPMKILFLGDVVGKPGRRAVCTMLPRLIDHERIDLVIANCENVAGTTGVDPKSARELLDAGVHVLTSGNHVWRDKGIIEFIDGESRLLRPANFPPMVPGRGWTVCESPDGTPVAVLNLIGRVFMDSVDCPFRTAEGLLPELRAAACVVIVDMHGETTSEKGAMGWFLAGKVSAVLGSHTHVQTADEQVLPGGTAYITDAGMCGPADSIIGVRRDLVVRRFLTHMPVKFEVAGGPVLVQGAIMDIDPGTGQAQSIRRVQELYGT
jgi:metallophosphoesterase (TIGR00282 family)